LEVGDDHEILRNLKHGLCAAVLPNWSANWSFPFYWNSTIEGKRPVGRPRSRWKDQVMKDIRRIKKDISLANNRKEWRKLVDEAKNLLGFQEPQ
jgi:hypothetical protein